MPGYKGIPSSDPIEQGLREKWYKSSGSKRDMVANKLSAYLWERVSKQVAADRLRHPKAKRNLPVPTGIEVGSGRVLP